MNVIFSRARKKASDAANSSKANERTVEQFPKNVTHATHLLRNSRAWVTGAPDAAYGGAHEAGKSQFARFLLKIGRIGRAKFGRARKMSYLCNVNHDSQAGRSHPMKLGANRKSNTTKNTLNVWQKLSTPSSATTLQRRRLSASSSPQPSPPRRSTPVSWQNTSPTTARSTHTS